MLMSAVSEEWIYCTAAELSIYPSIQYLSNFYYLVMVWAQVHIFVKYNFSMHLFQHNYSIPHGNTG